MTMIFKRALAASLALSALAAFTPAHADQKLVPAQSEIVFVSKQMGVPVEGSFRKFDARIAFDPRKPEGGSVALQIDTASAAFGIPMTDAELPKAPWFDAAHFPQAGFQTTAIRALGDGRFEMAGKLTLKGIARPLTVPVTIAPAANGQSVASGSFVLQRIDYKVGDGEWTDTSVIANEVQVRFKLVVDGLGAP